jgi:hypothetical protein
VAVTLHNITLNLAADSEEEAIREAARIIGESTTRGGRMFVSSGPDVKKVANPKEHVGVDFAPLDSSDTEPFKNVRIEFTRHR